MDNNLDLVNCNSEIKRAKTERKVISYINSETIIIILLFLGIFGLMVRSTLNLAKII
jgi:hypothetical protein